MPRSRRPHRRPTTLIYEENHINPNLADQGGIYKTKLRLDVHGREWKWAEIAIPANMKEGYKIKFPRYGRQITEEFANCNYDRFRGLFARRRHARYR